MSDICLMLHGSLQWGTRQVEEWHFLVEIYNATLDVVKKIPEMKLICQFGGQDAEWISKTHPEFIDKVKELMERGQVEIAVGGYSHNFQGATPAINQANLELSQKVCKDVFGVTSKGYWPAESMLNRGMPRALKKASFEYTMFDSLNVKEASELEFAINGKRFDLRGAFDETIPGLPQGRFENFKRRGEGAGILPYAMSPGAYDNNPSIVTERVSKVPLVIEISDWEHFTVVKNQKTQEIHMGTYKIGKKNEIDLNKIAAWEEILRLLLDQGHQFLTGTEAIKKHKSKKTLEILDGRDYTKNDLTRLVDACAWYNCLHTGLAGRTDPHRMTDEESYCYSYAGAKAIGMLQDLKNEGLITLDSESLEKSNKDVCISFCSAHRSGGSDFTVKQQVLDRINRVIETYQENIQENLTKDQLWFPMDLPNGLWPIALNLEDHYSENEKYTFVNSEGRKVNAYLEDTPLERNSLQRTHRLWLEGPIKKGNYSILKHGEASIKKDLTIEQDECSFIIRSNDSILNIEKINGGNISLWEVSGFNPFQKLGGCEFNTKWQNAPSCDEVHSELDYFMTSWGIKVVLKMTSEELVMTKSYQISADLNMIQYDISFDKQSFAYLQPLSYRLNPSAFGNNSQVVMIAEGGNKISKEPMHINNNVHHLGSEMIGFLGHKGLLGMSINRLISSPILRRHPYSGEFVLMDSRPINAADSAHVYTFSKKPVLECTIRLSPGLCDLNDFANWQKFHNSTPQSSLGKPTLKPAEMEWMKEYPHISEVNPYF